LKKATPIAPLTTPYFQAALVNSRRMISPRERRSK
jgi:hypothetical protein